MFLWQTVTSPRRPRPCSPECVVTEQSTTCCCFYRHICHGDGCHPGRLPGASHPCREDGRPLRARRASQTDVEAGGGGAAAAAGLNAESCRWKRCIRLAAGRPAPVTRVRLGLHRSADSWQMGETLSQDWAAAAAQSPRVSGLVTRRRDARVTKTLTRGNSIYTVMCDAWITQVISHVAPAPTEAELLASLLDLYMCLCRRVCSALPRDNR